MTFPHVTQIHWIHGCVCALFITIFDIIFAFTLLIYHDNNDLVAIDFIIGPAVVRNQIVELKNRILTKPRTITFGFFFFWFASVVNRINFLSLVFGEKNNINLKFILIVIVNNPILSVFRLCKNINDKIQTLISNPLILLYWRLFFVISTLK